MSKIVGSWLILWFHGCVVGAVAMMAIEGPEWTPPKLDERFLAGVNEQLADERRLDPCETCEGRGDLACPECNGAGWAVVGIAPEAAPVAVVPMRQRAIQIPGPPTSQWNLEGGKLVESPYPEPPNASNTMEPAPGQIVPIPEAPLWPADSYPAGPIIPGTIL